MCARMHGIGDLFVFSPGKERGKFLSIYIEQYQTHFKVPCFGCCYERMIQKYVFVMFFLCHHRA